jgi:hypothetical protein
MFTVVFSGVFTFKSTHIMLDLKLHFGCAKCNAKIGGI